MASRPRRNTQIPHIELLEVREVLSGVQPTELEQLLLERLNDIRANPAAYGTTIGVNLSNVAATEPLAMDTRLVQAARGHSQDMNNNRFFSHTSHSGASLGQRLSNVGFPWTSYGESIAAGFASPEAALQALIVDAGIPSLGHRRHLLAIDAVFKDLSQVGVGIVVGGTGPYRNYFTIDTASTSDGRPFITGSVFNDTNNNGKYDLGEAVGNLKMQVHGVGTITTFSSGGYSFQVSPGTYQVTFSGGPLSAPITKTITVGSSNVRLNILTNRELPQTPAQPPSTPSNPKPSSPTQPPSAQRAAIQKWLSDLCIHLLDTPLSANGMTNWTRYLEQGGSRHAVIQAFASHPLFEQVNLTRWVERTGRDIFGRSLTTAEIDPWVRYLQRGGSKEVVITSLMNNAGFNSLSHAAWLQKTANILLQRDLRPAEFDAWTAYLAATGNRNVAFTTFVRSAEFKESQDLRSVQDFASRLLGQTLPQAEAYSWVTFFQQGGTGMQMLISFVDRADFTQRFIAAAT